MKMLIILVIAFLALVYVYSFIKIRKRRKNTQSTVADFNEKYHSKVKRKNFDNITLDPNYTKYVTKYNSNIDYVTRDNLNDSLHNDIM